VVLTSDGRHIISASSNDTIKVWDIESEKMIATFTVNSPMIACNVSQNRLIIIGSEESGQMHFLRLEGVD